jgi:hypothetical protein
MCIFSTIALVAATLLTVEKNGIRLTVDSESGTIDPGRSVFLTLRLTAPKDVTLVAPDLRERVRGFQLAEEFSEPVQTTPEGGTVRTVNWKLVPEACADEYRIAPFVVVASPRLLSSAADDGSLSFVAGPIVFGAPAAREPVTGDMETDPKKDLPPLSWKLVGQIAGGAAALALLVTALVLLVRYAVRRVREHRMSPIERAWVELDRLLRKGLPGRGRYKDFYVELTMVVRRYVQRKYGVQAPHLTTEEFLRACGSDGRCGNAASLGRFLASADMVKFAGVEATPEMADDATESARGYLTLDARGEGGK